MIILILQADGLYPVYGPAGVLLDNHRAMFCGGMGFASRSQECQMLHSNNSWTWGPMMKKEREYPAMSKFDQTLLVTGAEVSLIGTAWKS